MAAQRRNARRKAPAMRTRIALLPTQLRSLSAHMASLAALAALLLVAVFAIRALGERSVERIVVAGKIEHLREEALREAISPHLDQSLLLVDLGAIQETLESLPWVYRAQLRRRFPDTLEVRVTEQLPIARWGQEGFLNHEANIIEVDDEQKWETLPLISGPLGSEARLMAHYQLLLERMSAYQLRPIVVNEDEFGQLRVELNNGLQLFLGDREFVTRLRRFLQLWDAELRLDPRRVARVDMRYEAGAAVSFDEVAQVAALTDSTEGK